MKRGISRWWVRVLTMGIITVGSTEFVCGKPVESAATIDNADTVQTVSNWSDLLDKYLIYRGEQYRLIPPMNDLNAEIYQTQDTSIQNDPDWYWLFNGGVIYVDDTGELSKLSNKFPLELVVYEDMLNNEIVFEAVTKQSTELESFTAPGWVEQTYEQTADEYTITELSKRRVVWKITLQPESARPSATDLQTESGQSSPAPMSMAMMGGGASFTNIYINAIERLTNDNVSIEISYPIGFTNRLDIFTVDIVHISPKEAIATGMQWRIKGGDWHDSGDFLSLTTGTYTVELSSVSNWISVEHTVNVSPNIIQQISVQAFEIWKELCGANNLNLDNSNRLYVCNSVLNEIYRYDPASNHWETWGGAGTSVGKFDILGDSAVDSSNNVYVTDIANRRIQVRDNQTGNWAFIQTGITEYGNRSIYAFLRTTRIILLPFLPTWFLRQTKFSNTVLTERGVHLHIRVLRMDR